MLLPPSLSSPSPSLFLQSERPRGQEADAAAAEMPSLEPPEDKTIRTLYIGGVD